MMTETDVDVLMWNNIQAVLFTKIKNRVQNNVQEMIYLCVSQKVLQHIDLTFQSMSHNPPTVFLKHNLDPASLVLGKLWMVSLC